MIRGSKLPKKPKTQQFNHELRQGIRPSSARFVKEEDLMEAWFAEQQRQGQCFRTFMFIFLTTFVLLLLFLQWDKESMVPTNIKDRDAEIRDEQYYDILNVKKDETQEHMEEAYSKKKAELEKKTGEGCIECQQQLVLLQEAHNAISTRVLHDYHKVLKVDNRAGLNEIKQAYEKAKADAEKGKGQFSLTEIKEAYDTMSHPTARTYYNLYGSKPPKLILQKERPTHGGWGVELGMGTFKYTLLKAWLDYFNDPWVEFGFLGVVFFFMALKIWNNRHELQEKIREIEGMDDN